MSYDNRYGTSCISSAIGKPEGAPSDQNPVNDILYGSSAPEEEKRPPTSSGISKDLSKKRAALAASKVQQYQDRLAANYQPKANQPKPVIGTGAAAPGERPPTSKPIIPQAEARSVANEDLTRFDKAAIVGEMPILKSSTVNVDVHFPPLSLSVIENRTARKYKEASDATSAVAQLPTRSRRTR